MNVARVNFPNYVTAQTELEQWLVKITRKGGILEVKQLDAINMRIADKPLIDALKESGLIYQGEDGEFHITEQRKSTTNLADQS